jgi:DNA (cytosine-5)-methyltransferase 1
VKADIFSFFSGCGLLDLGFEEAGFNVAFVNEFHPPFLDAYKYSRERMGIKPPKYGWSQQSVTEFLKGAPRRHLHQLLVKSRAGGNLTGFVGGPPCPDFSIGGKNRGHRGDNGRLSASYVDLILLHKPDFFLFENVKGLWRTKRHRKFYDGLKRKLSKAGYVLSDKLINAIQYGAPQDRERIILIGFSLAAYKRATAGASRTMEFPWDKSAKYPEREAFDFSWPTTAPFFADSKVACPPHVPAELTVQHWFEKNRVLEHPNQMHCFRPRAGLKRFLSVAEGDDSKKSYKRLHRWRYSPTACYGNNEVHLHPYEPRRISIAEALAIQSLPKNFELPPEMSLSNMFKTVGNGVPFLAAKAIALSIRTFLQPKK